MLQQGFSDCRNNLAMQASPNLPSFEKPGARDQSPEEIDHGTAKVYEYYHE